MGHDKYEYFSKIFNMPSPSTIDSYSSISVHASDGIMFDTLQVERKRFDAKNPDLEEDGWKRHGFTWLGFNGCKRKT